MNLKYILKIFLIFSGLSLIIATAFAWVVDIPWSTDIQKVSIGYSGWWDGLYALNNVWFSILTTIKVILMGLLVVYLVYNGFMMVYSMGSDEEKLSSSKRQLWYTLVWILFINIPGTLYEAF